MRGQKFKPEAIIAKLREAAPAAYPKVEGFSSIKASLRRKSLPRSRARTFLVEVVCTHATSLIFHCLGYANC